ncbi:MAG: GFA family protein [Erythrobacter sp.]
MAIHAGRCHCGAMELSFESAMPVAQLGARACQCSFCRAHGASWTSDPEGHCRVGWSAKPIRYRFGTKTADFLICSRCGMVLAATSDIEGSPFGVIRVECLNDSERFLAASNDMDLDGELLEARLERRAARWTPMTLGELH